MVDKRFATHDTFIIERVYNTSPARVFAAWANPEIKEKWFPKADQFDFRVGGGESNQGEPPGGGPLCTFNAQYQEIVPDQRIVYSYTMDIEENRISISLTTVEFKHVDEGTRLIYTEQIAFLDGHDTVDQRKHGMTVIIDRLGEALRSEHSATYHTK